MKKIHGIQIVQDRASRKLYMSPKQYLEKVFERFYMNKAKQASSFLSSHLQLSSKHSTFTNKEKEDMSNILYASAVGSLMYVMACTRPNITHIC